MLATVAALQLLVLAQASAPAPSADAPPAGAEATAAPTPAGEPARQGAPPAGPPRPRQVSLLAAEPLRGASAALAWAGWSSLGASYAIGFTELDDVGASLDYDWAKSESRLGLFYRRPFGTAGPFDVAGRLAVSWYVNLGSDYVYDDNHSDHGFELSPALILSRPAAGGLLSATAEAPMTVTTKYRNGFLYTPRIAVAYEVPLYPELTVGARVAADYRAGAGGAPLREGRGEVQFLVLVGYQVL